MLSATDGDPEIQGDPGSLGMGISASHVGRRWTILGHRGGHQAAKAGGGFRRSSPACSQSIREQRLQQRVTTRTTKPKAPAFLSFFSELTHLNSKISSKRRTLTENPGEVCCCHDKHNDFLPCPGMACGSNEPSFLGGPGWRSVTSSKTR